MGMEIFHSFFAPHHASGVQDSAGKDPRIMMIRDIGFKKESLYNYVACLVSSLHRLCVYVHHQVSCFTFFRADLVPDAHGPSSPAQERRSVCSDWRVPVVCALRWA